MKNFQRSQSSWEPFARRWGAHGRPWEPIEGSSLPRWRSRQEIRWGANGQHHLSFACPPVVFVCALRTSDGRKSRPALKIKLKLNLQRFCIWNTVQLAFSKRERGSRSHKLQREIVERNVRPSRFFRQEETLFLCNSYYSAAEKPPETHSFVLFFSNSLLMLQIPNENKEKAIICNLRGEKMKIAIVRAFFGRRRRRDG